MSKSPLVSIIVVNWNGGEIFRNCLETVSKIKYSNWELIIVDNGSSDGSEKYKIDKTNFKLIKNKENLGFAPANNIGYKASKGEFVLFLNNDTQVQPDLLDILVKKIQSDENLAVIQPKIKFMDTPQRLDNSGSFLTWTGFLTHVGFGAKDGPKYNHETKVFSAKGACMFVRRSVIETVGLFDDDFVSYFEESDFCWRVWLAGYQVLYFPKTFILHKVGFTSERLVATEVNYHSFKNRISALIKNLGTTELFKMLTVHLFLIKVLSFYYLFSLKFSQFWMIHRAIWWNVKNLGKLLEKRKQIQIKRVVNDTTLFKTIVKKFDFAEMFNHFKKVESNFISKKIARNEEVLEIGRIRACLELVKSKNLKNKTLIDIGCSTGLVISKITGYGAKKIIGIDPNQESISYAKKNIPGPLFFVANADSVPMNNNEADFVVMFDVIEHVPKGTEKNVFEEVSRVLKKNGRLLLSTPNSNFFTNLLDPAWYLGHRHYEPNQIKKMVEKSGLVINKISIRGSIWSSIYMLWFYVMKWIFNKKFPRNTWLEKKEDEGYHGSGIFTLFLEATK